MKLKELKPLIDNTLKYSKTLSKTDKTEFLFIPKEIEPINEIELRGIAQDIKDKKIVCDRHCSSPELFFKTFPIVGLFKWETEADRLEWSSNLGMLYEYSDQAKVIPDDDGNPAAMFLSCRMLNREDAEKVIKWHDELS